MKQLANAGVTIRRSSRVAALEAAPAAALVAAAAILVVLATRVRDWVVMTDELQYAKLATAIAQGDVLPTLRGQHVSAYAQVYPALLAPLYGLLSVPDALSATHVLNALLFASTAIPAYLLSRSAGLTRGFALAIAFASIAAPWNVLTAFVLTESAAYPIFVWTLLALHRSLVAPSARADVLALAALTLAFFTRTQFVVLALAFPLAVLAADGRRVLRRRLLLAAYAVSSVAALILAATGGVDRVLGSYAVTATEGRILSWRVFEQAGAHLDLVGIAIGLLPLLVGGAWLVSSVRRREPYGTLALTTIVLLTLATSSYDVRFGDVVRDRYVFYLAPLLFIALALGLRDGFSVAALAATTAFVAVTVFAYDFHAVPGLYVDSPAAVLGGWIDDSGGAAFVALACVVLAVLVLTAGPRFRVPIAAVVVALAIGVTSASAWSRLLESHGPSGRPVVGQPGEVLDWADRVLPQGAQVGVIPYVRGGTWGLAAILWWDVEFWNRTVDRSFAIGKTWEYAPFPNEQLRIDEETGRVRSPSQPQFVITDSHDARLRLAGTSVARNYDLDVLEAARPYRAEWITRDLFPDGWMRSGTPATVRVFAAPATRGPETVQLEVQLRAPRARPVGYRVVGGPSRRMHAGQLVILERELCVPPGSYADLQLVSTKGARIVAVPIGPLVTTTRAVGPRIDDIRVTRTGMAC